MAGMALVGVTRNTCAGCFLFGGSFRRGRGGGGAVRRIRLIVSDAEGCLIPGMGRYISPHATGEGVLDIIARYTGWQPEPTG